jgi:hypothetical protein
MSVRLDRIRWATAVDIMDLLLKAHLRQMAEQGIPLPPRAPGWPALMPSTMDELMLGRRRHSQICPRTHDLRCPLPSDTPVIGVRPLAFRPD